MKTVARFDYTIQEMSEKFVGVRVIRLARLVTPSSLTAPCVSLWELHAWSKRITFPKQEMVFSQEHTSSYDPLLGPPNKLSGGKLAHIRHR